MEPRSSVAPHFDGQRWLSAGIFQLCAAADNGSASTKNPTAAPVMVLIIVPPPGKWARTIYAARAETESQPGASFGYHFRRFRGGEPKHEESAVLGLRVGRRGCACAKRPAASCGWSGCGRDRPARACEPRR